MKYAVHLYATARVKISPVEADSMAEAIKKAETEINLHEVLDNPKPGVSGVEYVEYDEGAPNVVLVDPLDQQGEVEYEGTRLFDGVTGNPLIDGNTDMERKAIAADLVALFYLELSSAHDAFASIAAAHGVDTLVDLMHLPDAILTGGIIDCNPKTIDIVKALPSSEKLLPFLQADYLGSEPQYVVNVKMMDGSTFKWHGDADGKDHAEKLAMAAATSLNIQQVDHIISVLY